MDKIPKILLIGPCVMDYFHNRNHAKPLPIERTSTMNAITPAVPDWTKIDTPVKHQGKEIVLPSDPGNMDYDDAIETIARIRDQENQEFDVREIVKAAPWDAAVAIYRAMQDIYGVVLSESIKTFFGEIKPDFLTVQTGPRDEDRIQVPAGRMSLPGVEAPIFLQLF
jgi:hypothetical protein